MDGKVSAYQNDSKEFGAAVSGFSIAEAAAPFIFVISV